MIARKSMGILLVISLLVIFGCGKEKKKPKSFSQKSFPQTYPEGMLREIVSEKDGAEMVLIPAGEFEMGSTEQELNFLAKTIEEKQYLSFSGQWYQHTVYVDAFYIDRYEVTNAQYKEFVEATGHLKPSGNRLVKVTKTQFKKSMEARGLRPGEVPSNFIEARVASNDFKPWDDSEFNQPNQPVTCVSWEDAVAYAKWAGKRLPTEAEWEKAARGGLISKRYPWGDTISRNDANYGAWKDCLAPVGSFAPNGYGLYDVAGNVWEWVADWFDKDYYKLSPKDNPKGPETGRWRVLRGGSFGCVGGGFPFDLHCAKRQVKEPTHRSSSCGFRCAKDVIP